MLLVAAASRAFAYIGVSIVGASNSRDSPYRASFAAVLRVRKLSSPTLGHIHGYYASV